jgi:hypothetical protein
VVVTLPVLTVPQEQSWLGLLEVSAVLPTGWCLVGGQMVHLHCYERGVIPQRPTDDIDAALDVRGERDVLLKFTSALKEIGFSSVGESMVGHQHRWVRGEASIDVLIPTGLGQTAGGRKGASGGTTVPSPGSPQALDRAESITVTVAGISGSVRRPNLLGALVSKAAAHTNIDQYKGRHVTDFAILASLTRRGDLPPKSISKRDLHYLDLMLSALSGSRQLWTSIDRAEEGLARLSAALDVRRNDIVSASRPDQQRR